MRLHDTVKPTLSPWLLASAALVAVLVIMGVYARVKPRPKAELAEAETLYREGIDPDGRTLDYLMPRFALDDASMQLLIGYLRELSAHPAPGALTDILQFATVVTPDADPVKRDAMLEVLNHFFGNKNAYYRGADPPLQSERRIHFRVLRRWQLHVWELKGAPETWREQLEHDLRLEP